MEVNILKLINDLEAKLKELRTETTECPYTKNPKPMGNGKCFWCGEDHWTGD